jgi:raffinose/stachyose/melibiose transport system substrate-binding protein
METRLACPILTCAASLAVSVILAGCAIPAGCAANNGSVSGSGGAGCAAESEPAGVSDDSKNRTVIDVWHQWADQNETMESAVEAAANAYEQESHDVEIRLHGMDGETYKTKIIMDFAGSADDIDVFYYFNSQKLSQLLNAGRLLPINSYLTEETFRQIDPGVRDTLCFAGERYGLPIGRGMNVIYCRKDLFEKAGAKLPGTYEELLTEGGKLRDAGFQPLAVGAGTGWRAALLFEELILHEAGKIAEQQILDAGVRFSDVPACRTAAEEMCELVASGLLGPDPLEESEPDAELAFLTGKAAMLLNGTWEAGNIDASGIDPENISVIPFPAGADDKNAEYYIGNTGGGTFFVNSGTDTPAVSADFSIYLTRYLGEHAAGLGMDIPVWKNAAENISPVLQKIIDLDMDPENSMTSWDLALSPEAAEEHLELSQKLMTRDADIDGIMAAYDEILKK